MTTTDNKKGMLKPIKALHRPKDRQTIFSLIFSRNHVRLFKEFTKFAD